MAPTPEDAVLRGPEKAAVLLALVGEDIAADLVAELDEKDLLLLRQGLHRMTLVEQQHIDQVYEDVSRQAAHAGLVVGDNTEYLSRVLEKALGPERAAEIMKRIMAGDDDSTGIEALREMDGKILASFLRDEHPQTVAFILAHLYPGHAGEILSLLNEDVQKEVAYRITQLARTPPEVIEEVSQVLRNEIRQVRGKEIGGVKPLSEMLNFVDKATEERVLAGLEEIDQEMTNNVRSLMFTFEDLAKIDDKSMQTLIREVERDKWVLSLRTASPQMKKKVFSNMSERAGALLREEMESMGPVRLRDVESAQREVLEIARSLEAEGKIALASKGKEDMLV
ncbi:MAG TPA: flagellar motor switch protein FliG [Methylomirabilota bacterium]|jgi:flagellar motor switch protein FliG|nr:flagellar motor switch protein FliG [Methylomirabilota bacterium]